MTGRPPQPVQEPTTSLRELHVWCCDVQSSAASASTGQIIDIAWSFGSIARGFEAIVSTLVSLREGHKLERRVSRLTGIKPAMLEGMPGEQEVRAMVASQWRAQQVAPITLAHYARYERGFIEALLENQEEGEEGAQHASPSPGVSADEVFDTLLCTHEIARRVLPGLPRKGLRALAGYFGEHLSEQKRSSVHVIATQVIWRELVELLEEEHDVSTLEDLLAFCQKKAPRAAARTFAFAREKRLAIPRTPGVYRMLGRQGEVLYVGKATSLRQRVNSYFTGRFGEGERKLEMATQVWDVSYTEVDSPLEAALLEAHEIKRYEPPYNVLLRSHERGVLYCHATQPWRVQAQHDETFRLGPTSDQELFDKLAMLVESLKDGAPRVAMFYRLDDEELFLEALSRWRARRGFRSDSPPEMEAFMRLGEALIEEANVRREARRAAKMAAKLASIQEDVEEVEEEDQEEREAWSWSVEAIEYGFDTLIRRSVRHVLRGELIQVLQGAKLFWTPCKGPRQGEQHELAVPDYSDSAFGLRELDVMRVLLTELKRVVTQDEEVHLELASGEHLSREVLAARLRQV